jgi:hypothetical protein
LTRHSFRCNKRRCHHGHIEMHKSNSGPPTRVRSWQGPFSFGKNLLIS